MANANRLRRRCHELGQCRLGFGKYCFRHLKDVPGDYLEGMHCQAGTIPARDLWAVQQYLQTRQDLDACQPMLSDRTSRR
ncbi:MAG: hypothetical protein ACYC1V_00105 [Pirellulaceae bacterium]